jgi:hypothetical protein
LNQKEEGLMVKKMLVALRFMAMFAAFLLALIAILYVLDLISGDYLRNLAMKTMEIVGILTGLSLIIIFLTREHEKQ